MWGRLKTLVLAAVVGAAALVPLFGDPRSTPVTHPLWARMLLRSLDMTDAVRASTQASQVFATLAWRDSLSYPADRYLRAEGASRARGGRPGGSRRLGRPGRGVLRPGGGAARRLPAARAALGPARHAGDGRGPADGGRTGGQVLHPAPGRRDGLGVRRLDAPRPGGLHGPVPPAPRLHAQPGGDRPSLRELDRAGGRLEADRRDHEPGPRGDRAQGDRRRARAAAGVDADRDHGRPVPGGGSRAGGRGRGRRRRASTP